MTNKQQFDAVQIDDLYYLKSAYGNTIYGLFKVIRKNVRNITLQCVEAIGNPPEYSVGYQISAYFPLPIPDMYIWKPQIGSESNRLVRHSLQLAQKAVDQNRRTVTAKNISIIQSNTPFLPSELLQELCDFSEQFTQKIAAYTAKRAVATILALFLTISGLCQYDMTPEYPKLHADVGIGFSNRFRSVINLGATLEYDRVQFTSWGSYERGHNFTVAAQGGLKMYEHLKTGINTWIMLGPSYIWHSRKAFDSKEGVKDGLLPAIGLRVDYGKVTLDLNYNIASIGLRFNFQFFNNNR